MSTSSVRADGVRPPGAPSYIEARQRADRHLRVRARLLIGIALVHVAYLIVPILPCARCRTVVPWLLWLPPLCATLVLLSLIVSIRRWVWSRRQATQLIHLPPLQEGS
jgi:hypothetical protein